MTESKLAQMLRQVQSDALETAAKVCDSVADKMDSDPYVARGCATLIRALIAPPLAGSSPMSDSDLTPLGKP